MKHGMKHSHSPRHINAAKQTTAHARYDYGWWFAFLVFDFYILMYCLKFKADKFDILNKLATIVSRETLSFIRGDIRHKFVATPITTLILIFIILFTI